MKKIFLLLILVLSFGLFSCKSNTTSQDNSNDSSSENTEETKNDNDNQDSNPEGQNGGNIDNGGDYHDDEEGEWVFKG